MKAFKSLSSALVAGLLVAGSMGGAAQAQDELRIGTASGERTRYPLHHSRFDLDESALPLAARLMTEVCIRDLATRAA